MELINPALSKLKRPLSKLKPDPTNVRAHDARSIEAIKTSLTKYGQQKPIVIVPDGTVAAGNGTLEAAKQLGWTHLAVVVFSGTLEQARAFAVADNRTAELSSWDDHKLAEAMDELTKQGIEVGDLGFNNAEMEALIARTAVDLDKPIEKAPLGKTPIEAAEAYLNNEIKQVVLYLPGHQFEPVLNAFQDYAKRHGLMSNTEVVLHLLGMHPFPAPAVAPSAPTPASHG